MRTFIARPREAGPHPGIVFYSDIFQLTESTLRWCVRLAGYGFVVAAPEIYHRIEPPGTVLGFDDDGQGARPERRRGDAGRRLRRRRPRVARLPRARRVAVSTLGAAGHCTGGHIAFRAAMEPQVKATACWYATGLHDGKLGADPDAGSLARAGEIGGELLMIFGTRDPHTPEDGRTTIKRGLDESGVELHLEPVRRRARVRPRHRRPLRPGGDRSGARRDGGAVPARAGLTHVLARPPVATGMSTFIITPLPAGDVDAAPAATRRTLADGPLPCRRCLRNAEVGEPLTLARTTRSRAAARTRARGRCSSTSRAASRSGPSPAPSPSR